tara:strand:+ start:432 stop:785 length:354 start_codon:yes stop_codon:yes gene_type:complete
MIGLFKYKLIRKNMKIIIILMTVSILFSENTTTIFKVHGMMCAMSCPKQINASLNGVDGIKSSEVDFDSKTVTVTFDDNKINSKVIAKTISSKTYFKVQDINKTSTLSIWEWLFGSN